jgi:hypothetical protein
LTPTYSFSKAIASTTQRENVYNISPFVSEFVTAGFVNVTVKRYKETSVGVYSLLNTVNYTAVEAYNNYTGGYNQSQGLANFAVLANPNIDQYFFLNNPSKGFINETSTFKPNTSIISKNYVNNL